MFHWQNKIKRSQTKTLSYVPLLWHSSKRAGMEAEGRRGRRTVKLLRPGRCDKIWLQRCKENVLGRHTYCLPWLWWWYLHPVSVCIFKTYSTTPITALPLAMWLIQKNEHDEKIMHRIHFFIPKWAYPSFCCFIDLSIYLKVWSTETEEEKKRRGRERMREREQESSICWFTTQITTSTKSWARQIQELGDSPTFAHRCRHSRHIFRCIAQAISSYLDWQTAVGTWTHIRGCMSGNSITCQIPMLDSHLPFGFSTDMSSPPT